MPSLPNCICSTFGKHIEIVGVWKINWCHFRGYVGKASTTINYKITSTGVTVGLGWLVYAFLETCWEYLSISICKCSAWPLVHYFSKHFRITYSMQTLLCLRILTDLCQKAGTISVSFYSWENWGTKVTCPKSSV